MTDLLSPTEALADSSRFRPARASFLKDTDVGGPGVLADPGLIEDL